MRQCTRLHAITYNEQGNRNAKLPDVVRLGPTAVWSWSVGALERWSRRGTAELLIVELEVIDVGQRVELDRACAGSS